MTTALAQATAFDHLGGDDFDATPSNPHKVIAAVHPFELRGLGDAPFACIEFTIQDNNCAYCGKALKNSFHIKSADSKTFVVGSDCVAKTNAVLGGYEQYKARFDRKQREHKAARARALKAEKREKAIAAFKVEHPDVWAWAEKGEISFASAMHTALLTWGGLTPGQLDASYRTMENARVRKERAVEVQAERLAAAPVVADISAIEASFAKGLKNGLRTPKLRLGTFVLKPAKSHSTNPGAIYVTTREGTYLGKVMGGKFLRVRDCTQEQEKAIVEVCADPKSAAIAYGKKYGECCVCGRVLSDKESVEAGIGPICAKRYEF